MYRLNMPEDSVGVPPGTLVMLVLRVLQQGPLHGYAIAQRIHTLSNGILQTEEGSLYPALQKILLNGWAAGEWGLSESKRRVRFYQLTPAGKKYLQHEMQDYDRVTLAIQSILHPLRS